MMMQAPAGLSYRELHAALIDHLRGVLQHANGVAVTDGLLADCGVTREDAETALGVHGTRADCVGWDLKPMEDPQRPAGGAGVVYNEQMQWMSLSGRIAVLLPPWEVTP